MADGCIEIISGTLGGGKTLFAVERGVNHLSLGGYWATNIELHVDKIRDYLAHKGLEFDQDRLILLQGDLSSFHEQIPRGSASMLVMVTIDEAHLTFNARDFAKVNRDLLNFNTLVRKLDIHLDYITQHPDNLDKQMRRMSATTWMCRNLSHYKIWGIFPCPFPLKFRVPVDTTRGSGKGVTGSPEITFFSSWAYPLYNSKALLGDAAEKIGKIRQVHGAALKRITKPKTVSPSPWPLLAAASCAALYSFL